MIKFKNGTTQSNSIKSVDENRFRAINDLAKSQRNKASKESNAKGHASEKIKKNEL